VGGGGGVFEVGEGKCFIVIFRAVDAWLADSRNLVDIHISC